MKSNPVKGMRVYVESIQRDVKDVRVAYEFIKNRRVGPATLTNYVGGYGGDIWFAQHDDGTCAIYVTDEMEELKAEVTPKEKDPDFIFGTPRCPECEEAPTHIHERLEGGAQIQERDDGSFDYAGYTEVNWDSQVSIRNEENKVTLECGNHHTWLSTTEEVK